MKTIAQGLIYSFIATLAIYGIIKTDIINKDIFKGMFTYISLAGEATDESINAMCEKSSLNLKEFYETTPSNYDYIPPKGNEEIEIIAEKLLRGENILEDKKVYLKMFFGNGLTIFVFILIIFLIIFWIPFCSCICCKCCLCVPQSFYKFAKFIFIFCLVLCLAISIVCIVGFARNKNILSGVYGFGCTFLKIFRHLIFGDENVIQKPYWKGLSPILNLLSKTKSDILSLLTSTLTLPDHSNRVNDMFDSLENNLFNEYEERNKTKLDNPEPEEDQFYPLGYLNEYGPPNLIETTLGGIYFELTKYTKYDLRILDEIIDVIHLDNDTTKTIIRYIDEVMNNTDFYLTKIDNQIRNSITDFQGYIDKFNNVARLFMNIIFGINLALIIIIAVCLTIIYFRKFGHCLLCCNWSILYVFMILTIILGAIFLLLGLLFQNLSYGLSYVIHHIRDFDESSDVYEILDVCFNGDGRLSKTKIFSKEFNVTLVENIYNVEKVITEEKKKIESEEFVATENAAEKYNDFDSNPQNYLLELVSALYNVRKYIDSSVKDTKIIDGTIYDEWVFNKNNCSEGYEYLSPNSNLRRLETTYSCLVITEWNEDEINARYESINTLEKILDYYHSMMNFTVSKDEFISIIQDKNNEFKEEIQSLKEQIVALLDNILGIVAPFRRSVADLIGDGNIFDLLTCSFFRRDFNKFVEVLYKEFGSAFRKTSDLFFTICVFQIIMTLLILIIIDYIKHNRSKEEFPVIKDELIVGLHEMEIK